MTDMPMTDMAAMRKWYADHNLPGPPTMTDMEIPQAAVEAVYEARGAHRDASECSGRRCSCGQGFPTAVKQLEHETRALLGAALPHLQADTKAMCETATKVALELGRKEAAEIAAGILRAHWPYMDGGEAALQDCLDDVLDLNLRIVGKGNPS